MEVLAEPLALVAQVQATVQIRVALLQVQPHLAQAAVVLVALVQRAVTAATASKV